MGACPGKSNINEVLSRLRPPTLNQRPSLRSYRKPKNEPGRRSSTGNCGKMRKYLSLLSHRCLAQLCSDTTTDSYYVQTRDIVPLKSDFKPNMKVLSRKPAKTNTASDATSGIEQLNVDEDEGDEEDAKQKQAMSLEERQAKAQKDREEKQRKYEEVRQRLFGAEILSERKAFGNVTPPRQSNGDSKRQSRNRAGGDGRSTSSTGTRSRQLYDPSYTVKPDSSYIQKRDDQETSGRSTPNEQIPIRSPRGPDGSGGFAPRESRVT